jgi:hypothetical protein
VARLQGVEGLGIAALCETIGNYVANPCHKPMNQSALWHEMELILGSLSKAQPQALHPVGGHLWTGLMAGSGMATRMASLLHRPIE